MTIPFSSQKELIRSQGLSEKSAVVILSSCMKILYASPEGLQLLQELSESATYHGMHTPAILAYMGEGIMKRIQLQRAMMDYSPVLNEHSFENRRRRLRCSVIGIPYEKGIDETQIIFVFCEERGMPITPKRIHPAFTS